MLDELNDMQLRGLVEEINARDADRVTSLRDRFSNDDGALMQSIGKYRAGLGFESTGATFGEVIEPGKLDFYQHGAQTFLQVLSEHPAFYEERGLHVGIPIFGNTDDLFFAQLSHDV